MPETDPGRTFDRYAAEWSRRHAAPWPARLFRRWRTARLVRLCRLSPPARLLDVGCGTGEQLLELAPWLGSAVGIDASGAMIARARAHAERSPAAAHASFLALPIEGADAAALGTFDAVIFVGSLEHVREPALALKQAAELLRPDGRLAVVVPHPAHPRSWWSRLRMRRGRIPPFRHPWPRELRAAALAAGLEPVAHRLPERLENALSLLLAGSRITVFRPARHSRSSDQSSLTRAKKPSDSG